MSLRMPIALPRLAALLLLVALAPPAAAQDPGTTSLASVSSAGTQGNFDSARADISGDGRHVAFISVSNNLVPGDVDQLVDVFVHDGVTGSTVRASVSPTGGGANQNSEEPRLSGDGRHVAFHSFASNLVPGDTNGKLDVFVRDLELGVTERVSLADDGSQSAEGGAIQALTPDARFVLFAGGPGLVPGQTVPGGLFVRDRLLGTTTIVSYGDAGQQVSNAGFGGLSDDATVLVFRSFANGIVAGDDNGHADIFVRDLVAGTTVRISLAADGSQLESDSQDPHISGDGRWIGYTSAAPDIVAGDDNASTDAFLYDRVSGTTVRVSGSPLGQVGQANSWFDDLSTNGRYLVLNTAPSNLGLPNGAGSQVIVRDQLTGAVTLASVNAAGTPGQGSSQYSCLDAEGRTVAFQSAAANLVSPESTPQIVDIFRHQLSPWTVAGPGLPGAAGVPLLSGSGSLLAGSPGALDLAGAAPGAALSLFASFDYAPVAFVGGTLVAFPPVLQLVLVSDGTGALHLPFAWPAGVPSGLDLYLQAAVHDLGAVKKTALSNGLHAFVP